MLHTSTDMYGSHVCNRRYVGTADITHFTVISFLVLAGNRTGKTFTSLNWMIFLLQGSRCSLTFVKKATTPRSKARTIRNCNTHCHRVSYNFRLGCQVDTSQGVSQTRLCMHSQPSSMRVFFTLKTIKHFKTSLTEELVLKLGIPWHLVEFAGQQSFLCKQWKTRIYEHVPRRIRTRVRSDRASPRPHMRPSRDITVTRSMVPSSA